MSTRVTRPVAGGAAGPATSGAGSSATAPIVRDPSAPSPEAGGRFIYLLKQLDSGVRPVFEQTVRDRGFTAAQYTAMAVLLSRPGITSSELARRSFVRAQSMAGTMGPLLKRGLVERTPDPANARRLLLHATAHGRTAVDDARQAVTALERRLLAGLDATQLETLAATLRMLRTNVQEINGSAP